MGRLQRARCGRGRLQPARCGGGRLQRAPCGGGRLQPARCGGGWLQPGPLRWRPASAGPSRWRPASAGPVAVAAGFSGPVAVAAGFSRPPWRLTLIGLLLALTLAAPGAVSGVVKDSTGAVVTGASVVVKPISGSEHLATTGADGRFTVDMPVDGDVTVIVRA